MVSGRFPAELVVQPSHLTEETIDIDKKGVKHACLYHYPLYLAGMYSLHIALSLLPLLALQVQSFEVGILVFPKLTTLVSSCDHSVQ